MLLLRGMNTVSFLVLFSLSPLMTAEKNNLTANDASILNLPEFSITFQGDALVCSPIGLIKTKTRKDLVTYECHRPYIGQEIEKKQDEQRGHAETQRLKSEVKDKVAKGVVYSVEIPLYDTDSPTKLKLITLQQLSNMPDGKYLRMFLPAKIYMSIRPQITNSGEDGNFELKNGGSRGGFYYYYQFNNDLEVMFQYEAGLDWDEDTPFLNASDASNTNRRLSYFSLTYLDYNMVVGKYWSAYYDIAGFTDQFVTYGAQAGGAFNSEPSGTGRADKMVQTRIEKDTYNVTLQAQLKHDALNGWNTDYGYTLGASFIYKELEDFKFGAAVNYGEFDEITPQIKSVGIDGDDFSSILGLTYKKNSFSASTVLSYTQNHMSDDQGIYFDGIGAEVYLQYDVDQSIRIAGGGNWLFPEDDDYEGKFSINNVILSLQYTFGEKTFDDLVYVEVSMPNGKLANGESKDTRFAIGIRYLLDY
ncbi:MAG TPA: hypothetical protein VIN02_08725 [Sulfurovum sp.]